VFGERGGRKWAGNSPKLRAGRDREAAGRAASNLNVRPARPITYVGGDSPTPPSDHAPGEGPIFEPQSRRFINSQGIAADHLRERP